MQQSALVMDVIERGQQFQGLLERHRGILFKVANTYTRGEHDIADLVQEIATQAWRAFAKYDGVRPFSTWLYRIALNVAISYVRSAALHERHVEPLDAELHDVIGPAVPDAEGDEGRLLLYRCIDRLDPLNRALLLLYLDERSQREIAEILGISETNVATKIGRLKERLRNDMTEA